MTNYNSFYFLHIPKTAGRFFTHNVVIPLSQIFEQNKIKNFYDRETYIAHRYWANFITTSTYVSTLIRDPVKHSISSYCHWYGVNERGERKVSFNDEQCNKKHFINWFEHHIDFLSNLQSKSLLISELGEHEEYGPYGVGNSPNMKNCKVDIKIIENRIKEIAFVCKSENLQIDNIEKIHKKILCDFDIKFYEFKKYNNKFEFQKHSNYWNPDSSKIYSSLTNLEKNKIYSFSPIDSELYNTEKFFTKWK